MEKSLSVFELLNTVEDPRSERNRRYELASLLSIVFLAALSGIDSYSGIADWATMNHELSTHNEKCYF